MKTKKNLIKKPKKPAGSIVLYIASAVTAILGIGLLVNNILLYRSDVATYVQQGYELSTINKQLIPAQLIPGIVQPIGMYLGIAFILFGAGIINEKISKNLKVLNKTGSENKENAEENIPDSVTGKEKVVLEQFSQGNSELEKGEAIS